MVFGQLNVETVNPRGRQPDRQRDRHAPRSINADTRVNPIRILDAKQLAVDVPVASTAGRLQASVSDVRAEVKDNALNLYITYSFSGAPLS
jgi:hypothetical protein